MMRKVIMTLIVLMLSLWLVTGAGAQGMFGAQPPWVDEIPQPDPVPWEEGQYAIYDIDVTVEGEAVGADMRFAIIGEESIAGENYYWFEIDVFNIDELPEDMGMEDEFESVKLQLLMKEYDMSTAQEDPEAFVRDLLKLEFIKRVIFQLNDDTPYEIDLSFLQMMAPMIEMSMESAMADESVQEEMEGMWDNSDWGYDYKDITTPAGAFDEALHVWFSVVDDDGSMDMDIHSHQDVPIIMLVRLVGTVQEPSSGDNVDMEFKVIEIGHDATGWIEGEPILWSFDMMGDMMGEMTGGM